MKQLKSEKKSGDLLKTMQISNLKQQVIFFVIFLWQVNQLSTLHDRLNSVN